MTRSSGFLRRLYVAVHARSRGLKGQVRRSRRPSETHHPRVERIAVARPRPAAKPSVAAEGPSGLEEGSGDRDQQGANQQERIQGAGRTDADSGSRLKLIVGIPLYEEWKRQNAAVNGQRIPGRFLLSEPP